MMRNIITAALFLSFSSAVASDVACTQASDCGGSNGGVCARSEALQSAGLVCCSSSEYINFSIGSVCTGRSAGAACAGDNDVCASGVCGMDNLCKDNKFEDESSCRNDAQCLSGTCARSEASSDAGYVCCTTGDDEYINSSIRSVCTGRSAGAACAGEDNVCRSGSCDSNSLCTKQLAGSSCNGNDDDCMNSACGRLESDPNSDFICCPSEETVLGGSGSLTVCTNIAEESYSCFDDSICKSGVCILGVCQGGKEEEENEPCEKDTHCASNSCKNINSSGIGSCGPFSSLAAKNEYFNGNSACPLGTLASPDINDRSTITLKVYGDSSKTSWTDSIAFMVTEPIKDLSPTANVIVGQELLDGIVGCHGGNSVVAQRQGDQVCLSYQVCNLAPSIGIHFVFSSAA